VGGTEEGKVEGLAGSAGKNSPTVEGGRRGARRQWKEGAGNSRFYFYRERKEMKMEKGRARG
jgi:hypothetical protein